MNVVILGYGRSGRAAESLAKALGHEVAVLADDAHDRLADAFDRAIVSPGVALSHPWIAECRARGIPLKSELQFGCEELKKRGWKLLAVTGSKGKSSVVKVVADAINLAGGFAVSCGNYGLPVSEVAVSHCGGEGAAPLRWAVVEVSSFMMETTELPPDTFEAAAVLNLQEDHLDRHGSVEVYHALKMKLLTMAKRRIAPCGVELSTEARSWCDADPSLPVLPPHGYFDNPVLAANGAAAAELMRAAQVPEDVVVRAFREFVPLPHRMDLIAERDGVRYIDDSKATSLAALVAGVEMVHLRPHLRRNVRLIAGGLPKGDDPKIALSVLTKRVKKVYLIGQSAETFGAVWKGAVDCEICGTMEKAVASAMREAEKGETVLLSPGSASFDQFRSFEERGDVFADLVRSQSKDKNKNE